MSPILGQRPPKKYLGSVAIVLLVVHLDGQDRKGGHFVSGCLRADPVVQDRLRAATSCVGVRDDVTIATVQLSVSATVDLLLVVAFDSVNLREVNVLLRRFSLRLKFQREV